RASRLGTRRPALRRQPLQPRAPLAIRWGRGGPRVLVARRGETAALRSRRGRSGGSFHRFALELPHALLPVARRGEEVSRGQLRRRGGGRDGEGRAGTRGD